jgi:hypothetical protein
LVGPGGACITSTDSQAILEAEANEKLQKKIDAERAKRDKEIKRRKLDEAAAHKKELAALKKNQQGERNLPRVYGRKKSRQKNKVKIWLSCYDCGKWCCADCQPSIFSTACSQVYRCKSCLRENEK